MRRLPLIRSLLALLSAFALALPAATVAAEAPATTTTVAPVPSEEAPATPTTSTPAEAPASTTTSPETETEAEPVAPQIQSQQPQGASPSGSPAKPKPTKSQPTTGEGAGAEEEGGSTPAQRAKHRAVSPSTLTPALPLNLRAGIGGVPSFFIESFQVPPFLLPIFQAAGTAYGIPWQVLAAINEVETDYGRDLSVSSAGAEGWMQFLPSSWAQYGVDANGDGYKDPYNPADAIFAAARYLRAAGGETNIKAAIFSYNHSQAYVESVMLRAQLLGGTPSELLGAITGLTEARFPVHAAAHFSDGFPTAAASGSGAAKTLVGTTIYSQPGAPVIAVQDGEVVQIGDSPALGSYVSLRDAYGNTYIYAQLGDVSSVYPVLEPREQSTVSPRISQDAATTEPAPSGPATAGAQARSPISEAAVISGLALGATAGLETIPAAPATSAAPAQPPAPAKPSPDVHVVHGRLKRCLPPAAARGRAGDRGHGARPRRCEQHDASRGERGKLSAHPLPDPPGGPRRAADRPEADPRRLGGAREHLDLQGQGREPVPRDLADGRPGAARVQAAARSRRSCTTRASASSRCGRQDVQEGRVDRRVLAMLEYLSVSGLKPTVVGPSVLELDGRVERLQRAGERRQRQS